MIIRETERLIIRSFQHEDQVALQAVLGDPDVMRFSDGVKTLEEIREWICQREDDYKRKGFGLWAVVQKDSGAVIGYCGLTQFGDICGQQEIEIGYRLKKSLWGQGFASEAAKAVKEYAFTVLGFQRLIALVDPENLPSIRVAVKLGMTYEKEYMGPGYNHPDHVYVNK